MVRSQVVEAPSRPIISRGLLILLGLAAVGAAGYWFYHAPIRMPEEVATYLATQTTMYCGACGGEFPLTLGDLEKIPVQDEKYRCPTCGKFSGVFSKPAPKASREPAPRIMMDSSGG